MYCRKISPSYNFTPWEAHHFYIGLVLTAAGFLFLFNLSILSIILSTLGIWISIDDIIQHFIQAREIKTQGFYTTVTFWHWFPYLILEKINEFRGN